MEREVGREKFWAVRRVERSDLYWEEEEEEDW